MIHFVIRYSETWDPNLWKMILTETIYTKGRAVAGWQ